MMQESLFVIERVVTGSIRILGECARCKGEATVQTAGGKSIYCAGCGRCAGCHRSVTGFVPHPTLGIPVCPCVAHYSQQVAQENLFQVRETSWL